MSTIISNLQKIKLHIRYCLPTCKTDKTYGHNVFT